MASPNLFLSLLLVSQVILSMPSPSFAACLLPCEVEEKWGAYLMKVSSGSVVTFAASEITAGFGRTLIHDWKIIYNGGNSARAKGMHFQADLAGPGWFFYSSFVFNDTRYAGSSIQVMGILSDTEEGQLAIIGGTGKLAMARGVIKYQLDMKTSYYLFWKLNVHVIYAPPTAQMEKKMEPQTENGTVKSGLSAAEAVAAVLTEDNRKPTFLKNIGVTTSRTKTTMAQLQLQLETERAGNQKLQAVLIDMKEAKEIADAATLKYEEGMLEMRKELELTKLRQESTNLLLNQLVANYSMGIAVRSNTDTTVYADKEQPPIRLTSC